MYAVEYGEASLGGVGRNVKAFHGDGKGRGEGAWRALRHAASVPADEAGSPYGGRIALATQGIQPDSFS